jgi:beta-mannosidase
MIVMRSSIAACFGKCSLNRTPGSAVEIVPNWADVTREEHRLRLAQYRDLGVNILRINACQFLESADFYELCDEYGIMVWQEMPLTSSGVENTPPDDPASIDALCRMARTFVARRQHHPSLVLWGGGNELLDRDMKPYDVSHPMLGALQRVFQEEDPARRYVPTSPSGPRWGIEEQYVGKGLHWDVHGPWKPKTDLAAWKVFWESADALFYSEIGAPGAAPAGLIRKYAGELPVMPVDPSNPLYCITLSWWTENAQFETEKGRAPTSLEEYVDWSQARQAETLAVAVRACKARFPRCGGVILWCGHDCFPCAVNTSIVDFEGAPKPAALALAAIYKEPVQ